MEQGIITCPNHECQAKLKKTGSPFVRCGNCRSTFFSFCHQFPNRTFEYVQCKKCPNELYYFFCVKCKETLCFKNYKMGSVSKCKCGFEGCYVVCNHCKNSQCFPPNKKYQGISWSCEKCHQPFNFMTCDDCFSPIYAKQFRQQQKFKCQNKRCAIHLKVKRCKICQELFLDSKNLKACTHCQKRSNSVDKLKLFLRQLSQGQPETYPLSPPPPQTNRAQFTNTFQTKPSGNNQQVQIKNPIPADKPILPLNNQSMYTPNGLPQSKTPNIQKSFGKQIQSLCKICLDKPSQYINLKCFHMSCCQKCMPSMKNICPLCRAQGQFHKVYR